MSLEGIGQQNKLSRDVSSNSSLNKKKRFQRFSPIIKACLTNYCYTYPFSINKKYFTKFFNVCLIYFYRISYFTMKKIYFQQFFFQSKSVLHSFFFLSSLSLQNIINTKYNQICATQTSHLQLFVFITLFLQYLCNFITNSTNIIFKGVLN